MFRVGETVGVIRLKNAYDQYVLMVLGGYLEKLETARTKTDSGKSRRLPASYNIAKQMPTVEEYKALKVKRFTSTAGSLMEEAYSEITSLAEEMREWYDNLTEGLQSTDRGQRVSDAADTLEGISA
jgi:hypothetical protein